MLFYIFCMYQIVFYIMTPTKRNEVYTPEESGPFFPVARAWAHASSDFGMVLFDWDVCQVV